MAEILKFVAHGSALIAVPGAVLFVGQSPVYVNREHKKLEGGAWGYPAVAEPHVCAAGSDEAMRLARIAAHDGDVLPFDEATAAACGMAFRPLEFKEGAWAVKLPAPAEAPPAASQTAATAAAALDGAPVVDASAAPTAASDPAVAEPTTSATPAAGVVVPNGLPEVDPQPAGATLGRVRKPKES